MHTLCKKKPLHTSEATEIVIEFVVKLLSHSVASDGTWCSFSWTTGMRVRSSVH